MGRLGRNLMWPGFGLGSGASTVATLTIASGKVSADLTDYPVYVDMSNLPLGFWSTVAADGSNMRIRQAGVDLPFDLVFFDYAGHAGQLFFKASLLAASNNVFTVVVVPGATAPAVGDPLGRNAVWSAFHRVVHGRALVDRTGSGAAITQVGAVTVSGGKYSFAANAAIYMPTSPQPGSYSMLFFGFATGFSVKNYGFLSFSDSWSATPNRQTMAFRSSSEQLSLWNNTDSWLDGAVTNDPVTFTAGMSKTSGSRKLYVQAAAAVSSGASANIPAGATPVWIVGAEDSSLTEEYENDAYFAALAFSVLPAAWFSAFNTNMKTPTSFYGVV